MADKEEMPTAQFPQSQLRSSDPAIVDEPIAVGPINQFNAHIMFTVQAVNRLHIAFDEAFTRTVF